jgi:hypothetical protein
MPFYGAKAAMLVVNTPYPQAKQPESRQTLLQSRLYMI